jgi:hypothetical protein
MTRRRPPETGDDDGAEYDDHESASRLPRWVTLTGIVLAVVALIVVVVLLVGGGHSPRRHGSGTPAGQAPPTSAIDVVAPHIAGRG